MHEDISFPELRLDGFQMDRSSLARALLAYPQTIFATLVWLRREHDALALAKLTTDPALRARILCTIAQEWRERADSEKLEILQLLSQAQACLASLQEHPRIDAIRKDLVEELAIWQQWSAAQELADTISTSWQQEQARWSMINQMLEAGLWEEALAIAPSVGDGMFYTLCETFARTHAWDSAEEAVWSIKETGRKIDALSMLARELAAASEATRAKTFWQRAVQVACEEEVSPFTLASLSEDLTQAHQWELAEGITSALLSFLPRAKEAENATDLQTHDHANALWMPVLHSRVLATLAGEYTRAHCWERVGTLWEEAQTLALSCQRPWHQTVALGHLTLRLAEAHLWERALNAWSLAEARWQEARAHKETAYEVEERERRLSVLIPLCHHLVRAQQWERAWILCQELEEASMKIRLGSEIATELDRIQQSTDALTVWTKTSELALAVQPSEFDLSELALALEQAKHCEEANLVWNVTINRALESDQEDFSLRTLNCGRLALEMAQRQHGKEAELLLNESMKAAIVLWGQRLSVRELAYTDL